MKRSRFINHRILIAMIGAIVLGLGTGCTSDLTQQSQSASASAGAPSAQMLQNLMLESARTIPSQIAPSASKTSTARSLAAASYWALEDFTQLPEGPVFDWRNIQGNRWVVKNHSFPGWTCNAYMGQGVGYNQVMLWDTPQDIKNVSVGAVGYSYGPYDTDVVDVLARVSPDGNSFWEASLRSGNLWLTYRQNGKYIDVKSTPINYKAGKFYYIELIVYNDWQCARVSDCNGAPLCPWMYTNRPEVPSAGRVGLHSNVNVQVGQDAMWAPCFVVSELNW